MQQGCSRKTRNSEMQKSKNHLKKFPEVHRTFCWRGKFPLRRKKNLQLWKWLSTQTKHKNFLSFYFRKVINLFWERQVRIRFLLWWRLTQSKIHFKFIFGLGLGCPGEKACQAVSAAPTRTNRWRSPGASRSCWRTLSGSSRSYPPRWSPRSSPRWRSCRRRRSSSTSSISPPPARGHRCTRWRTCSPRCWRGGWVRSLQCATGSKIFG